MQNSMVKFGSRPIILNGTTFYTWGLISIIRKLAFLPRDAMRKRGLCCNPVFVRLSVRHVMYCIQLAEDIVKLLSRPGSPVIIVF